MKTKEELVSTLVTLLMINPTSAWGMLVEQTLLENKPEPVVADIQIGDVVRIVKPGKLYNTYHKMFHLMGFKNPEDEHDGGDSYTRYVVFAIEKDLPPGPRPMLFYGIVSCQGEQLLFSREGIQLCNG